MAPAFKIKILPAIAFYFMLFLFVWIVLDPVLFYQVREPVFYNGWEFFNNFLYPGGPADYAGQFFYQFFHLSWLGAAITAVLLLLAGLIWRAVVNSIGPVDPYGLIVYLPGVVYLGIVSRYVNIFPHLAAFILTLVLFRLYVRCQDKMSLALPGYLFSAALVYLIGGGFLLFYSLLVLLFEVFKKKRYRTAAVFLLVCLMLPLLSSEYYFLITRRHAFTYLLVPQRATLVLLLYALFFLTWAVTVFFRKVNVNRKTAYLLTGFVYLAAVATGFLTFEPDKRQRLAIAHHARYGEWENVLQHSRMLDLETNLDLFYANRALYFTGRMGDELLSFPQDSGNAGLFLPPPYGYTRPLLKSDIYWELGFVNEAQHWAHEAVSQIGETPWNLQRLALTYIVEGEYDAAGIPLQKLSRSIFYRDWAQRYLHIIDNPELIAGHKELAEKIKLRPQADFPVHTHEAELDLETLLEENPQNKMVFEYLMAFYLLNAKVGQVAAKIEMFQKLGYRRIPRLYQEAALLYLIKNKDQRKKFVKLGFNMNTLKKYMELQNIVKQYKGNLFAARNRVYKEYGHTYWFYIMYFGLREKI